jgi:hypothetical protein
MTGTMAWHPAVTPDPFARPLVVLVIELPEARPDLNAT